MNDSVSTTPAPEVPEEETSHRSLFLIIGIVFIILAIVGLLIHESNERTEAAEAKANELIALLQSQGMTATPSTDSIVAVLGEDGGHVCEDPVSALNKALSDIQLSNGAATVGMRPILADARVAQGEALILQVYCPDELPEYLEFIEDKKYEEVIKG